jgi:glycosyltransferase involved in cell wall biosynthesis
MTDLFIGITTWNDIQFLKRALQSLRSTLTGVSYEILVWDNLSQDGTVELLQELGVRSILRKASQSEALCELLALSQSPYTLLMHSDVILLDHNWFPLLQTSMQQQNFALISPDDIGCGMYRKAHHGMPESSFLFFDTKKARSCSQFNFKYLLRNVIKSHFIGPLQRFDFYGPHITHRIPSLLARHGLQWDLMTPLPSIKLENPWFEPPFPVDDWQSMDMNDGDSCFDYGYGNFYAYHGVITHYHNWYGRYISDASLKIPHDTQQTNYVLPLYCQQYMERFFKDYDAGTLRIPPI